MVGSGKDGLAEIQFTDVHEFSFAPGFPYVNILRKWWYILLASFKSLLSQIKTTICTNTILRRSAFCFSVDFQANEAQAALNGQVSAKVSGAKHRWFNSLFLGYIFPSWVAHQNDWRWKTRTLLQTFLIGMTETSLLEIRLEIDISSGLEGETFYSISTNPFL